MVSVSKIYSRGRNAPRVRPDDAAAMSNNADDNVTSTSTWGATESDKNAR